MVNLWLFGRASARQRWTSPRRYGVSGSFDSLNSHGAAGVLEVLDDDGVLARTGDICADAVGTGGTGQVLLSNTRRQTARAVATLLAGPRVPNFCPGLRATCQGASTR